MFSPSTALEEQTNTEEGLKWPKGLHVDENVCSCMSILIVAIYPSKDTEKYITDDEAVRSNIKLLDLA